MVTFSFENPQLVAMSMDTPPAPEIESRSGWGKFQDMTAEEQQDIIRRLSASPDNFRYDPRPRRERFEDRREMSSFDSDSQARLGQREQSGAITGCSCEQCRYMRARYEERRGYWSAPNLPTFPVYQATWQMNAEDPREMNATPAPRRMSTFGSFAFNPAMQAINARIEAQNTANEAPVSITIDGNPVPVQSVR